MVKMADFMLYVFTTIKKCTLKRINKEQEGKKCLPAYRPLYIITPCVK